MRKPKRGEVFCGQCAHFFSGYSDRHYEHCAKAKVSTLKGQSHRGKWTEKVTEEPAEKNAANDCKDFRRGEGFD